MKISSSKQNCTFVRFSPVLIALIFLVAPDCLNKAPACLAAAASNDSSASQSAQPIEKRDEKSATSKSVSITADQGKNNATNENQAVLKLVEKARQSLSKNNPDDALKLLARALQIDNSSMSARRLAAVAYLKLNAPQQAIKQLRFLLASGSAASSDWASTGDAYLFQRDYEKAAEAYKGALRLNANCHQALAGMIRLLAAQGQYDEALAQCSLLQQKYGNEKTVAAYYQAVCKMVQTLKQNGSTQNNSDSYSSRFQLRPDGQGGVGGG